MPFDVRLPDGTIVKNVPEGTTQEDLVERVKIMRGETEPSIVGQGLQKFEELGQMAQRGAGHIVRGVESVLPQAIVEPWRRGGEALEEALAGRREETAETQRAMQRGEIGPVQATTQFLGKGVAGPALDLVGEAFMTPARGAVEALPETVKEAVSETFSSVWEKASQTPAVREGLRFLGGKAEDYARWKSENPQAAKTLESAINIGLVAVPVKRATIRGRAAKMEARAARQLSMRKADYVDELILPKETPLVRKEMAKRAKEVGVFRKRVVSLTSQQQRMSKEVQLIKGVNPRRSLTHNGSVIRGELTRQANDLDDILIKSKVKINPDAVKTNIKSSLDRLKAENPLISSERRLVNLANEVERNAHRILGGFPDTPHGVLQARRQFDGWARRLSKTVHERGEKTDALREVVANIRQSMNDSINRVVPSKNVKQRLLKQSNLLSSLDNIDAKMFGEGSNAVIRTIDRLMNIPQARNKIVGVGGTLLGAGIVGGSAMLSGPIAAGMALTGATVMGGKFVMGPTAKRGLAKLLRGVDFAIGTTKNPSIIRQLRADRAIIADMIKNSELVEEPDGNQVQQ